MYPISDSCKFYGNCANENTLDKFRVYGANFRYSSFSLGNYSIFPGNALLPYGGYELYRFYANDWLWGSYLVISGLTILLTISDSHIKLRGAVHTSLAVFWLVIAILVVARIFSNSFSSINILLTLPFLAISFFHVAVSIRLASSL